MRRTLGSCRWVIRESRWVAWARMSRSLAVSMCSAVIRLRDRGPQLVDGFGGVGVDQPGLAGGVLPGPGRGGFGEWLAGFGGVLGVQCPQVGFGDVEQPQWGDFDVEWAGGAQLRGVAVRGGLVVAYVA